MRPTFGVIIWCGLGLMAMVCAGLSALSAALLVRHLEGCVLVGRISDLQVAAEQGDTPRVAAILELDPGLVNSRDSDGWTPLHEAARGGFQTTVRELLREGADPNARNVTGATPLHVAAAAGEPAAAAQLVEAGADVAARDLAGATPLDYATQARNGRGGVVKVLSLAFHRKQQARSEE